MLNWLIRLLQKIFNNQPNNYQYYVGKDVGVIQYSSTLITQLKDEHEELVNIYSLIGTQLQQRQFAAVHDTLECLKDKFNRHVMQENVQFYCYLEKFFQDEARQLEEIKRYRKEMNHISLAVVKFIKKWQAQAIDQLNYNEFATEYEAVGAVLAQRIDQEEHHLYTLYQSKVTV